MRNVIFKYPADPNHRDFRVRVPKASFFLSAQMQDGQLEFWFCTPTNFLETEERRFELLTTGQVFDFEDPITGRPRLWWASTVQVRYNFVVHIFEVRDEVPS